jgi:hypothetical protein
MCGRSCHPSFFTPRPAQSCKLFIAEVGTQQVLLVPYSCDTLCFSRTSPDIYLTEDSSYSMSAAMITNHSLPKATFRSGLFRLSFSFSSPLFWTFCFITCPHQSYQNNPKMVLSSIHLAIHPCIYLSTQWTNLHVYSPIFQELIAYISSISFPPCSNCVFLTVEK